MFSDKQRAPGTVPLRVVQLDEAGVASEPLVLHERAPRQFEARFTAAASDEVHLFAEAGAGDVLFRERLVSNANSDRATEFQVDPQKALDLTRLSAATGGLGFDVDQSLAGFDPLAGGPANAADLSRLWPWFVLLALLTYLLEIYYRRSGLWRVSRS